MDNTELFLRIKALTHAIDIIFANQTDALIEDANMLSMMLVELVDEYDLQREELKPTVKQVKLPLNLSDIIKAEGV